MKSLDNGKILYCDNHLLVVEKPADMATQPDLALLAKGWIKKKFHKPGAVFLEPVHRLDKDVGGLVLFARTSKALSRLQMLMREKKIEKIYHALVEGEPPKREGRLVHLLEHGSHRALVGKGKESILDYKVLRREKRTTLLEIHLVTGRYHQIRAQLSAIGNPIVGDKKYGSRRTWPIGIALRHVRLRFVHPVTHQEIVVSSAIPLQGNTDPTSVRDKT